ncbi:spore coat protein CotJB [Clostridium taeniosporum]|uniref:Spore coat protein CotJB n=1 Tax=Clostridium taeniosporum TaxID=394958 RepID=A0A1D7XM46_9CLOT|nr:spore coat protein CotJB [Clostridium taeniosporum]AOR24404.1 spore coat protein CotJB [Clostridium taeniosporum]
MYEKDLLDSIMIYQFSAIDLNLFLDNFPDNEDAKKDYDIVSSKLTCLINEYEKNFAPLTNFGTSVKENPHAWVEKPWPWEKEN